MDDLENEVVTLRGTITGLATEIDSLERELASVPGDLATAQQTGAENSADLDRLEGDVDRLESTVGQVQADVAAAQTDIETLNGTPTEVQPLAQGETELQIRSPVAAVRSSRENTATFTGEIENLGDADAQNIIVEFRARNEEGAALGDVSVTVGTVRRGESRLFTATFRDVGTWESDATYVTQADYTITYSDGDSVRLGGTGTIVVL